MKVELLEKPTQKDWLEVKRRALVTIGKKPVTAPTKEWKHDILRARHSPIRRLFFSFYIECPYWVSVHLCRHIHAQPYVKSQRNDRQNDYNRNSAPQDAIVSMIWDMNAEELITIANKRLCKQASAETREVVQMMCDLVVEQLPEFKYELVPNCVRNGGECYEFISCKGEIKCK
jgi:thymidylate synthase ThyX